MFARTSMAVFASSLLIGAVTRDAAACSDTGVSYDGDTVYTAPQTGQSMPANVGRLFLHGTKGCPSDTMEKVTLKDGAGVALAFTSTNTGSDWVINPTTPLTPGSYKLGLSGLFDIPTCAAAPTPKESVFSVTAAVPAPTSMGSVTVEKDAVARGGDSCTGPTRTELVARLNLAVSDSLKPYASVVRYETWVDGRFWGTAPYGSVSDDDRWFNTLVVWCGAGGGPLAPGAHQVEVRAMILGGLVPSPPPIKLDVDLTCDGGPSDASVTDAGSVADASDASPAASATPASAEGCSYGLGSAQGGGLALALTALLALGRRKR